MPARAILLDTNVFLRFLTGDNEVMATQCRLLFARAEEGEFELHTSHVSIAELVWTLRSFYGLSRAEIAHHLAIVLDMRSLRIEHKEMVRAAVERYRSSNVDFIDAYHAAELDRRGLGEICSFDRDFDALGVTRVEPAALLA